MARDLSVGWAYAGAGIVALWRRPANRTGVLLLAEGVTWFVGNLQGFGQPVVFALGAWGEALNLAVLAHLLLAFPEGRVTGARERRTVTAGYALAAVGGLARALLYDPATSSDSSYLACRACDGNALLLLPDATLLGTPLFDIVDLTYRCAGALLTLWIFLLLVGRWRASSPARRRMLLPAGVSVALALVFVGWEILYVAVPGALGTPGAVLTVPSDLCQIAVPVSFLLGLLRMRLRRASAGNLVIAAGAEPSPRQLQDVLRQVLGDPSLRLGLSVPGGAPGAYEDPDGRSLPVPVSGSGVGHAEYGGWPAPGDTLLVRGGAVALTVVALTAAEGCGGQGQGKEQGQEQGKGQVGGPLAVMVYDSALCDDPALMASVAASVRLCLRNAHLAEQAVGSDSRARALHARLLHTADEERRRLERDLHDGAQTRLVFALMNLRRVGAELPSGSDPALRLAVVETEKTLRQALSELRDIAHGIHPAVLSRAGLGPAVTALAEQAALPVVVLAEPGRYPEVVETTAYFVVSEALANAAKHASAGAVSVRVRRTGALLAVEVADDGTGGADPAAGSGLRGLADRVSAAGGTLRVDSPPGGPTRILAELPCA
ncbi:histidine kinase [Streptomyces sp. NPDC093085]|uniref:sensor histidine kinase n=1 Tax=Streptomyces sp. NPDC093085 TaxID=3155068 RepID=UPI0034272608